MSSLSHFFNLRFPLNIDIVYDVFLPLKAKLKKKKLYNICFDNKEIWGIFFVKLDLTWFLSVEYQVIVSCHLHSALNCYKPFLTDTKILYTHLIFSPQKLIKAQKPFILLKKDKIMKFLNGKILV